MRVRINKKTITNIIFSAIIVSQIFLDISDIIEIIIPKKKKTIWKNLILKSRIWETPRH